METVSLKTLDKTATIIFCTLLDHTDDDFYLHIDNEPFMPLALERVTGTTYNHTIPTPYGYATLYSLCHYGHQDGDWMRDPEMCFIVVDRRGEKKEDWQAVHIIPYSYENSYMGFYEESVLFEGPMIKEVNENMQQGQVEFANGWLLNIKAQGYLDQIDNQ